MRFFWCWRGCSLQSKQLITDFPPPSRNSHGARSTYVRITRVHFRVPKPENIIIFKIYLAATLSEQHPNYDIAMGLGANKCTRAYQRHKQSVPKPGLRYCVRGLGTLLCTLSHGLHVWSRDPGGSILRRLNEFLCMRETISNLECGQASGKKGPESSSEETSPQDFLLDIIFLYIDIL